MMSNTSKVIYLFGLIQFVTVSCAVFMAKSVLLTGIGGTITPLRWLTATILPLIVVVRGLKKKSLNWSGALLAMGMGFCTVLASTSFFLSLLVFFITSSKATSFRESEKRKIEGASFKERGQRNWVQVICNGGVATEISLLYLMDIGASDLPVDFAKFYRASWLGTALLGSLACSGGDTWASELGTVMSKNDPHLITTFRKVPKGTNGGISLVGLLCSFGGGLAVGLAYYLGVILSTTVPLSNSPSQIYLIALGGIGGLLGSVIDSLLGATVQYSGYDKKTKSVVEIPGPNVEHISGIRLLDNHSVNLVSGILTALIMPKLAMCFY